MAVRAVGKTSWVKDMESHGQCDDQGTPHGPHWIDVVRLAGDPDGTDWQRAYEVWTRERCPGEK